jgi:hypothetical protein
MAGAVRRRWAVLGILVLALLAPAGCGGDDDGGGSSEVVSQPEPAEPIESQAEVFNEAIAGQDCEKLATLSFSTRRFKVTEPGAAPSPAECRDVEGILRKLKGVELQESAEFGTGAMSEGTALQESRYPRTLTIWVVDRDGYYRRLFTVASPPLLDTEVPDQAAIEDAAAEFVQAVEEDDCKTIEQILGAGSPLAAGSPRAACQALVDGKLFSPALEATPKPELEFLGGTRWFSFVGVPTADAYFTIVLGSRTADGQFEPTIQDVVPSTELELPQPEKG